VQYYCIARLRPVTAGLFYWVLLLTLIAAVWFPKSQRHWNYALDRFGAIAKKERKMVVLDFSSWTMLNVIIISALCWWKIKLPSITCFIAPNIHWDGKISSNTVNWFSLQVWWRITPIFNTATNIIMEMVIVGHVSDISNLSNYLPVGPLWCIQSIVLTVKDGLTVTRWYFNMFCVFLTNQHTVFK